MIYLDNAATTLIKPASVHKAVMLAMKTMASPGRGSHEPTMKAAEELYLCRCAAAELFNVPEPENVVFTMNATHGLNIAIKSLTRRGRRAVISGFEHNSVLRPLAASGAEISVAGRKLFEPDEFLEDFERKIKNASLAVCTHVSNAFGYILPVYEAAELCRKYSVPLIVDASQSAGILNVDMERLGAAFAAMPGHKGLFGPQGTGILLCGERGIPLMEGGSGSHSIGLDMPDFLPDRLEAGTHNVCGIAGLRAGMEYLRDYGTENILRHEEKLLKTVKTRLKNSGYELFSGQCQSGLISLRHSRVSPDRTAEMLGERGICTRSGLHCAPLAHKTAGTIETGTLRMSFSPFVTERDVRLCCDTLLEIV